MSFTEDEWAVLVFRPEFDETWPAKRVVVKMRGRSLGQVLHNATRYADDHPKHIVSVIHRIVMYGEWEDAKPTEYVPPVREEVEA